MIKNKYNIRQLNIKEIEQICDNHTCFDESFLEQMAGDSREGVKKLYKKLKRKNDEHSHLEGLYVTEKELWSQNYLHVAGVDEAGRGPLAGPVVAAAVVLPGFVELTGLKDSKKITSSLRKKICIEIKRTALDWSVGTSTVNEILTYNIHWASLLAMKRAVCNLSALPDYVLIDGYNLKNLNIPQKRMVGGDGLSASIAAASVIAKVTRDELMKVLHQIYPQYGFDKHKGYGTREHIQALEKYGAAPIHRTDFSPVKKVLSK
ncbi:MAG: ribonuclease HII [Clostridiales bacterium]|nr:ribonuclease HII [Clostridiales bacterium]MCF8022614.1 ribonuclease HII [Clostridiales bacterium]